MKTTMTPNFVTNQTFNRAVKNIDQRFDKIDQRFDTMESMIRQEVKRVDDNSNERFNIFMEQIDGRFRILMEHPVFANHKA